MSYPGLLTRAEFATGLITRGIKINGNYLLVDECNINQTQNIDMTEPYIQGGPGSAVAFFDAKKISGNLSFPLRVDAENNLEKAAKEILNHAQNPSIALTMDTNHILAHQNLTAENHATDNNKLIKLDSMIITSLTISCNQNESINVNCTFEGMIDNYSDSDYVIPDFESILGRALSWGDCNAFRKESSMRTVNSFKIQINNNTETPSFLLPYNEVSTIRNDQISFIGIKSVKWSGSFTEFLRSGADLETFIHGGWMIEENLTFQIGPIKTTFQNPVFKIAQLPLTSSILTRTTEWSSIIKPKQPLIANSLFTYN